MPIRRQPHAALLAALTVAALARSAPAAAQAPAAPAADEPIAIVDLRADAPAVLTESRAAFRGALAAVQGISAAAAGALDQALAGDRGGDLAADADAARAAAAAAYGELDCDRATAEAKRAVAAYAALQARGQDVTAPLRQVYAYAFLCAHGKSDADTAMQVAHMLRRASDAGPPPGVDPMVWNLYPALDATTNIAMVEIEITTAPAGATVWFDHRRVGASPVTVVAAEGPHVVAAALGDRAVGQRVDVVADGLDAFDVALALPDVDEKLGRIAHRIARWRAAGSGVDAESLALVMGEVAVRFAVVMTGGDRVEVWALGPGERVARKLHEATTASPVEIGAAILARARRWDRTGPDPNIELLRETPTDKKKPARQRWWVYATIIGAVVVGGVLVVATDFADDRQRIQVTIP